MTKLFAPLLLTVAVLAAACGDDGNAPLSRGDFVSQANAICVAGDARIEKVVSPLAAGGQPSPQTLQTVLDGIVAESHKIADQIDALDPPANLANAVDAMLVEFRAAIDRTEAQGLAFFDTEDDPFAKASAMAADIGLASCQGDNGDGGSGEGAAPAPIPPAAAAAALSREDFIAQANAVCTAGNARIENVVKPLEAGGQPSPQTLQTVLDGIVAESHTIADQVDALEPPADLADAVDALVAEDRAAIDRMEAQGPGFFDTAGDPFAKTHTMAADLGLTACSTSA